jgi:acetyl-CoA acetyltransferase
VNRLCGSGLEAINQAGRAVETDHGDLFVAGGVESMTRGPWVMGKPASPFQRGDVTMYDSSLGWRFPNKRMGDLYSLINNGETAENVAEKYQISRKDQDEIALASHQKAVRAQQEGRLKDEIMPIEIVQRKGARSHTTKTKAPGPTPLWKSSRRSKLHLRKADRSLRGILRRSPTARPRCW